MPKSIIKNDDKRELQTISIKDFIDNYSYKIDMDADYQRDKIWSLDQRKELLDSIIENIDIPKIYLAEVKKNKEFEFECIDGKQRMVTLLNFFKPEPTDATLTVTIVSKTYTYEQLQKSHQEYAKQMENYKLHFLIYQKDFFEERTDDFINKIFRRLQLGIRLNAGETLKSYTGTIRNFIFKEISGNGPFLKNTGLSMRRYQKELALAQICYNSFTKNIDKEAKFLRARTSDIEKFFESNSNLKNNDKNLSRIKNVLDIMDTAFGKKAENLSGRAAIVSAYLYIENLYINKKQKLIPVFVKFYLQLLNRIKENMQLIRHEWAQPNNRDIMDGFQKYILQASVEPSSIRKRNEFLEKAFEYYLKKSKIIGDK
ncbi:MAG: DUF262 domain-containing protein [Patescibacteria group bacterium]|nr:DUF262 domain-containing protein [Patescibacteria group bacterium]